MKTSAIVLSAGRGTRMKSDINKTYMELAGKPIIYYTLKAFEDSFVDEIILVVGKGDIAYAKTEIVEAFGFQKVRTVVEGGAERYHSVAEGLKAADSPDYVFIQDGARPFLTQEILERSMQEVQHSKACVVGMPVKDTIKLAGDNATIIDTPPRSRLWMIQTPQVFAYQLVKDAYMDLLTREQELLQNGIQITDDAMVVEVLTGHTVKLVEGSYRNIKITTPEDLLIAEAFLQKEEGVVS